MFRKILTAIILCILLAACASAPQIRSDYDKSIDFSGYKTFAFIQPLATDQAGYSTLLTAEIKRAIKPRLEARGYRYDQDNPDLLINFNAKAESKVEVTQAPIPPYYDYRGMRYSRWGSYGYETTVDQYKEGTLNIDIIDAARKQLVWEGVAIGRVTPKSVKEREARINAAVTEILAQYPFRASLSP